jgi:hypothetical protein
MILAHLVFAIRVYEDIHLGAQYLFLNLDYFCQFRFFLLIIISQIFSNH